MPSPAYQAGLTAKNAHADALILGHYSSRYPDVNLFKQEAQEVFKNVFLAEDGKKYIFDNWQTEENITTPPFFWKALDTFSVSTFPLWR